MRRQIHQQRRNKQTSKHTNIHTITIMLIPLLYICIIHTYRYRHLHLYICACAYTTPCTRAYTSTSTHAYTHACTYTCIGTYLHSHPAVDRLIFEEPSHIPFITHVIYLRMVVPSISLKLSYQNAETKLCTICPHHGNLTYVPEQQPTSTSTSISIWGFPKIQGLFEESL